MRRLSIIFLLVLLFVNIHKVRAHQYKKDVLGDSTEASDVNVPPVTAGPGIILPDSIFYGLDKLSQNIKLFLASSPEKKAQIHTLIARERLAELRIMMAKNNSKGIILALEELAYENKSTAKELNLASAKGQDVKKLALEINSELKRQREFLDVIGAQSNGALKLLIKAAKENLKAAKVEVEDELPEDELLKEVEEAIILDMQEDIEVASESAIGLERSIDVLTKLASQAAEKDQEQREEALRKAIENKSEVLKRKEEKSLELEKKKEEKIYQLKKEAVESAREMVKDAHATAEKFEQAKKFQTIPSEL